MANNVNEVLRALTIDELEAKLRESKEELFRLTAVRKEIARIYTIMRERELGIGIGGAA